MTLEEVRDRARRLLGPECRVCRECNGVACAGQVPGMGGIGTGRSFINNYRALASWQLNLRCLHTVSEPAPATEVLGIPLALPVMGAPVAGAVVNFRGIITEEELAGSFAEGCVAAGTVTFVGDGPAPETFAASLNAARLYPGRVIVIAKPLPEEVVRDRLLRAVEAGAAAVGVDVDAAGILMMRRAGERVGPMPAVELARLVESVGVPFVAKGIMTPDEAELAAGAGCAAIVVSNHGGRVLDDTPGTADVLPAIARAVKGRLAVLVDGGIRTGGDVLKCLALGADAVLVGRPLAIAAIGGRGEGVRLALERFRDELLTAMVMTGCPSPARAGHHLVYIGSSGVAMSRKRCAPR
ncbi:MAG: alpha-hydroxy-acid oxidizing protein [Bacillota bacterium]|nr:alpha-hydroxy-acid oxidizing protein [Bacillota bacterium]